VLLQHWRIRRAWPHIPDGARVLDVGTYDGLLFRVTGLSGLGVDPELLQGAPALVDVSLVRGEFPSALAEEPAGSFDAATALAVVEHVPEGDLPGWSTELRRLVRPGGVVVFTVPSPAVDRILHVLMRLRLVGGMEVHQHHGFLPDDVLRFFCPPQWQLVRRRRFQLGLNNLFVLRRTERPAL